MASWKIKRGIDALYSGAPVWWQERADAGLLGAGFLFGCIWDTDNNGEVIQFAQDNFFARYFIKTATLIGCWDRQRQMFVINNAKLLVMADEFHPIERKANRPMTSCTRNRKAVPIWTYYY